LNTSAVESGYTLHLKSIATILPDHARSSRDKPPQEYRKCVAHLLCRSSNLCSPEKFFSSRLQERQANRTLHHAAMFDRSEGRFDGQDNLSTGQGHSSQGPPPQYESSTQSRPTTDSKQTAPPPTNQESSSRIQFASVSFHQGDRIRIMQLSVEICDAIRIAIQDTWPRGIQQERGVSRR